MILKEITIENFRSIRAQTISNIDNGLVLIGKNNAGKSAILSAIRAFWGDYSPEEKDFHKTSETFNITAKFFCTEEYLDSFFYNSKIGILKCPSNATEFGSSKTGTEWEETNFTTYKDARDEWYNSALREDIETANRFKQIWLNAVKAKLSWEDEYVTDTATCNKNDCKIQHNIKDILVLLPQIAFIDDTRNFAEEEQGKSKSITSAIFNDILSRDYERETGNQACENCNSEECECLCINDIYEKSADSLTVQELQKLINYKAKNSTTEITQRISEQFSENYQSGFRVNIKATSNVSKSFSLQTKIYDPALDAEVEMSNVGAGVRSIYILSLLQAYNQGKPGKTLFMVEEPELYLHPQLQKEMAKALWKISETNQVLFTTHSPTVLNGFALSDVRKVHLNQVDYCSIIERASLDDILDEIGYTSQDILNTDFVLFVEGEDDIKFISAIINKYYNIDMDKVTIIDTKSCQNIETYATLRFLQKTTISNDFAIIRDCDTYERPKLEEKIANQLRENIPGDYSETVNAHVYITPFSSIEGFFLDLDFIVNKGVFSARENAINRLKHSLQDNKQRHIDYYNDHNADGDRQAEFLALFDEKVESIPDSLPWLKENIRGHDLFGYVNGPRITIEEYVDSLSKDTFADLFNFLDTIEFFNLRRID